MRGAVLGLALLAFAAPAHADDNDGLGIFVGAGAFPLGVDLSLGYVYAFATTSLLQLGAHGGSETSYTLGVGPSFALSPASRWRLDLFLHGSPVFLSDAGETYFAFGVGLGVHVTFHSGVSFALRVPVFGYAVGTDVGDDSGWLRFYYLATAYSFPYASLGYRF